MTTNPHSWTVNVEEDKETGELVLPLPVDMLSQLGWSEGTDLFWIDNDNGSFTITDKKPEVQTSIPVADDDVGC
jgi:hypothetical protein